MPKIDVASLLETKGSRYPAPYDEPCRERAVKRLGDAAGLTQFGVNLLRLPPGAWASQRHWHAVEDEFVYVLSGEPTLVTDEGETVMCAGECAAFPAGVRNGHTFRNLSNADVVMLVVGSRSEEDWGEYSDIDMMFGKGRYSGSGRFTRKDGSRIE
jgi:uncharacterized cupin superfamily protein